MKKKAIIAALIAAFSLAGLTGCVTTVEESEDNFSAPSLSETVKDNGDDETGKPAEEAPEAPSAEAAEDTTAAGETSTVGDAGETTDAPVDIDGEGELPIIGGDNNNNDDNNEGNDSGEAPEAPAENDEPAEGGNGVTVDDDGVIELPFVPAF